MTLYNPNVDLVNDNLYTTVGVGKFCPFIQKRSKNQVVSCLLAHLSRRRIGEHIVYPWSGVRRRRPSASSVRRTSSVSPSVSSTMLKHLLLRNRLANQNQILCGASLGRENVILFAASGSHDQDGRHAHIW